LIKELADVVHLASAFRNIPNRQHIIRHFLMTQDILMVNTVVVSVFEMEHLIQKISIFPAKAQSRPQSEPISQNSKRPLDQCPKELLMGHSG
jgi:hypothetical protein